MVIDLKSWMVARESEAYALSHSDCTMTLADWVVANGSSDPVAPYRGAYHTDEEMYALIKPFGDLVGLVSHFATNAGLSETNHRRVGCIAVIGTRKNLYRQWGAIWDGARWQVRLKNGFVSLSAHSLKIWSV